ncbi:unnamed protein product [Thelazia callipaeda]|uniref:DUF632 domain-containing protein n=1 Tax=Thelazia callipaeda TaxID=103827 RepID=A0A0N5D6V1_THECL|nr:unnamed protein product [Thelazia callipaeda]
MEKKEDAEIKKKLEQTLSIFKRLSLKASDRRDDEYNGCSKISQKLSQANVKYQNVEQSSTVSGYARGFANIRALYRYKPYWSPIIRISDASNRNFIIEKLGCIKLKGDIRDLRILLAESTTTLKRSNNSSCSLEARCSSWDLDDEGVDGAVAELAEYFDQFVTISLKMSALAESMYA